MTNLGPRLTQNILQPLKGFQIYIKRVNSEMEQKSLTVNELKEIFLIKLKVMMTLFIILSKNFFRELCNPLLYIYLIYHLQVVYFLRASSGLYMVGESSDLGNYRQISVLPYFFQHSRM